ncbi:MAG: hypothetical protein HDR87_08635 [Bacteroides sp.]|nr:hypothetical protein [Bacteroides sp.]
MKSKVFLLLAANLMLPAVAEACGPWNPMIPTPPYFVIPPNEPAIDFHRGENLRLWQSHTSAEIPLADIEEVVYRDSKAAFQYKTGPFAKKSNANRMYSFLNDSNHEAIEFLELAKGIEETRRENRRNSPWYYPSSKNDVDPSLENFISKALSYNGSNLKERYAMQACRALFASNQFARCVEVYDSAFADVAPESLMKRMAGNYVGGSLLHLGDTVRANVLFARGADINSLKVENPMEFLLEHNPDAPQIMDYLRRNVANDSARMAQSIPLAKKALLKKDVTHKGDWALFLAYFNNNFANNPSEANKYLSQALASKFSSEDLKNQAIAYKMKVDGKSGNEASMLAQLKWLDAQCNPENPDAYTWNRRRRNIIYSDWIPQLWKRGDYATAILLADYADSKNPREYDVIPGDIDRGSLTFQLMASMRSDRLAEAHKKIMKSSPLFDYLRQPDLQNPNVFNDLIGTLALREGNYARAIDYLVQVGIDYQRSMKINRHGYLGYDPFIYYPERWNKSGNPDYDYLYENSVAKNPGTSPDNAKLLFARQMLDYQKQMTSAPTADERAWARLMFALGRRNSLEQCWALTQYWRGWIEWRFLAQLRSSEEEFHKQNYGFLYDYTPEMAKETERVFRKEVAEAMKMMKSDETRARAEYALGNLKTIAKKYPSTALALTLKTSCDNWKNWL